MQPRIVVVMGEEALEELNDLQRAARPPARARSPARSSGSRPRCDALFVPGHRPLARRRAGASASSGAPSARSASGTRTSRRTRSRTRLSRMAAEARVLVVANRTAECPELLDALRTRTERGPASSPCWCRPPRTALAWAADMHGGGEEAEQHREGVRRGAAQGGAQRGRGEGRRPRPARRHPGRVQLQRVRRADRLDASPAHVQVAPRRPAAQGGGRHWPAGDPRRGSAS